MASDLKRIYFT